VNGSPDYCILYRKADESAGITAKTGWIAPSRVFRAGRRRPARLMERPHSRRLLICVIGSIRGGPIAWKSLLDMVVQPLEAHLAILGRQTHPDQSILFDRAQYTWDDVPEYDDWGEALDMFASPQIQWRAFAARNNRSGLWGGAKLSGGTRRLAGSGAIIFVLRQYLLERLQFVSGQYKQVMLTRSDHFYACPHPRLPAGRIWVPSGEDYVPTAQARLELGTALPLRCVTERHVVFPAALAAPVLGVLPWLLTASRFHAKVDRSGLWPNPECALGSAWLAGGVWKRLRRYPRCMFTVRRATSDRGSWRQGQRGCRAHPRLEQVSKQEGGAHTTHKYCTEKWMAEQGCKDLPMWRAPNDPPSRVNASLAAARRGRGRRLSKETSRLPMSRTEAVVAPHRNPSVAVRGRCHIRRFLLGRGYGTAASSNLLDRCCSASAITTAFGAPIAPLMSQPPCAFGASEPLFDPPWRPEPALRRCAVVSSARALLHSGCGEAIDRHDMVLRVNMAPTRGSEGDVGRRTELQVLNSHNARELRRPKHAARVCAAQHAILLFGDEWIRQGPHTDNESAVVAAMNVMQGCRAPRRVGRKALKLSSHVGAWKGAINARFDDSVLRANGLRRGSRRPTAGFYAVHTAMALCQSVTLFGFTHDSAGNSTGQPFHYFGDEPEPKATRHYHSMTLEHAYYQRLAAAAQCVRDASSGLDE
jgi:hypothetical protein